GSRDSLGLAPSQDVLRAVRFMGLVDAQEQDSLNRMRAVMADSAARITPFLVPAAPAYPQGAYSPGASPTSTYPASQYPAGVPASPYALATALPVQSRIYGLDIFRRSTSQFEPDLAGPVDASYKLGPRDVLALILTGGVENSYTLEVTREGFVVIPQVG